MLRTRVIPCLLLYRNGLVKTVRFKDPKYVGDPINAVKIFNEKEVDELVFIDIQAPRERTAPNFDLLKSIASEAFMPLAYGGGLNKYEDVQRIFALGVEKVILNSVVAENPSFVTEIANHYGSQSVVVSVDVKTSLWRKEEVMTQAGKKASTIKLIDYVKKAQDLGAGEILLNSIDRDGLQSGYDLELIKIVSRAVSIPVVACGGAGGIADLKAAIESGASAVAAGSMFVFYGKHRAVLITYPTQDELNSLMK